MREMTRDTLTIMCVPKWFPFGFPHCQARPRSTSYRHHPAAAGQEPRRPRPPPILGDLARVPGSPFGDFTDDRKAFW